MNYYSLPIMDSKKENMIKAIFFYAKEDKEIHEILNKYDFYEQCASVPDTQYEQDIFTRNYGHGDLKYKFYQFYFLSPTSKSKYYMVAVEEPDQEEIKNLAKFCQCRYHLGSWLNPMYLIAGPAFYSCLDSYSAGSISVEQMDYDVLRKTRKFIQANQKLN